MTKKMIFEDPNVVVDRGDNEPAMLVDVDGYTGPLDLLLDLARKQKVDLHKISVLALADQYLHFIEKARTYRLELAADYLVMAAWLAYLKSRLLLPAPEKEEEVPAEDLASRLAFRLRRLEAMREAAKLLFERAQLGRDFHVRGMPEQISVSKQTDWQANLYDLLRAYADQRQVLALSKVRFERRFVWSLPEARAALEKLLGENLEWAPLDDYLIRFVVEPQWRSTVRASSFSATLEMVREGVMEIRQDRAFAPLFVRTRSEHKTEVVSEPLTEHGAAA
jgi:segregation and condensation protein A